MRHNRTQQSDLNRNTKDSVFRNMFSQEKYVMQLYKDLHPEDTESTLDDVNIVTIERVISRGVYNDLGFTVGNRLLVLIEAQSTWSPNIALRMLMYLSDTYKEVLGDVPSSLYGTAPACPPVPEIYVVYTGKKEVPSSISLRDDVFRNASVPIDLALKVLTKGDGIIGEYVLFSQEFDRVSKLKKDTAEKVDLLMKYAKENGILLEYLSERTREVRGIMFDLFDQEAITRWTEKEIREEAIAEGLAEGRAEGLAKGLAEGRAEGRAEGIASTVSNLMKTKSLNLEDAFELLGVSPDDQESVMAILYSSSE